jgi:hypothetical protein
MDAEDTPMRKQILASATALALALGMTTSAMAFGNDRVHSGVHTGRFEGVRGFNGWRHGDWGAHHPVGGYGDRYNDDYGGMPTYCPALSRCGAGLGSGW